MVNILEKINIINLTFVFYQKKMEKLIYLNQNEKTDELNVLELSFSESEKMITKIDIYTYLCNFLQESIHITRGIDDIVRVDYYPTGEELIMVDKKNKKYNISIFKTYSKENNIIYERDLTLMLKKKKCSKTKILTKSSFDNNYYLTLQNKSHYINSPSITKLDNFSKDIFSNLLEIEKKLFLHKIAENNILNNDMNSILASPLKTLEEIRYPKSIYIYDRNYELISATDKTLIYHNTEDNIMNLEIYLSEDRSKIQEVRVIEFMKSYIDDLQVLSKKKIIRMIPDYDNHIIKASLCNRSKESIKLNYCDIENTMISAKAFVNENSEIEDLTLIIKGPFDNFELTCSNSISRTFVDSNHNEYLVSSSSYLLFRNFISFGPGILRRLQREIFLTNQDSLEKVKSLTI